MLQAEFAVLGVQEMEHMCQGMQADLSSFKELSSILPSR